MADVKSSDETTKTSKPMVIEKSLVGLDGWLGFQVVAIGASAVAYLWAFFMAIAGLTGGAEGVTLAVAIETLIFSLGLTFLCGMTLYLITNRKKLGVLWAYITLGVTGIYTTVVSFTSMFASTQSCSNPTGYFYTTTPSCQSVGLSASEIIMLFGAIFATWAGVLLMAYYFKTSQRVKLTLVK